MSGNGVESEKAEEVKQPKQRLNSYSAAAACKPAPPAEEKKEEGNLSRSGSKKSTNSTSEPGKKKTNSVSDNKKPRDRTQSGSGRDNGDRRNSHRGNGPQKQKSVDKNNSKKPSESRERRRSSNCKYFKFLISKIIGSRYFCFLSELILQLCIQMIFRHLKIGLFLAGSKSRRHTSNSVTSNGESFDFGDEFDLDEPFSDSDEDAPYHREISKPSLQIPRGRIRTLSGTVPPVGYSPLWGGPTMCLSCLEFFNLPDDIPKFTEHLLKEHSIVVEEMELIVDPKRYIEHWRQRFAKDKIEVIFPKVVPDENNPYHGKTDYYYEMSERIQEDYAIRQRLAMRRLEEALACQQREREEVSFSMHCVFCRYVARGNRAKLIHHLYMIHHLNLGSPDNLVFVHEYIEHLREKLNRNECIYCEKTFSDRNVLMDHMRKRNHREVNPKNNYYDKFYIINYLELGKRWLDVLAEDFEDTMPSFQDSDDEEEDLEWHEWQEDNTDEDQLRVVCLFCDDSYDKVQGLLGHLVEAHKFDLVDYIEKEKLDVYGRMKLLNHIRKEVGF